MQRFLSVLFVAVAPMPVVAHPHIFVDTSLRIVTDENGHAIGVEVTWAYDELYSLLVLEDMGLDSDYDGVLTPAELARLDGFDMKWVQGFEGDLYARGSDGPISLVAPKSLSTRFEAGKIITRHLRPFPSAQKTFELRAYDPTFYTAYDLSAGGVSAPSGCAIDRQVADLDAAYAKVEKLMSEDDYAEDDYPKVGDAFADKVIVTCTGAS